MQPKHHVGMTGHAGVVGLVAILALTGCASAPSSDGNADGDVHFPEVDQAWQPEGSFVNVDDLRQMRPGVSKNQIYTLLGRPHFQEGLFGVREWNYIFHFRTGAAADDYVTCQYQVRFDGAMLAESLHWRDPSCATYLEDDNDGSPSRTLLSADALFAFDSAELTTAGRTEVAALADQLEDAFDAPDVLVVGHTDHLGSEGYNLRLSQYRADAVRRELIEEGVAPGAIRSLGVGEQEPVATCERALPTPDLKACLQPDRRVEVEVQEGRR